MDAVTEVVLPRQEVDAAISDTTRILNGAGLLILLLAALGVLQIRRRQVAQDRAATHDVLTGLGNRVLLRRRAGPLLAGASADSPVSLLLIDLDGFKGVNDTLGHRAGDELLVAVAQAVGSAARPGDTVVRLGGDEVAVLLPLTDVDRAVRVGQDVRRAVRVPVQLAGLTVEIDASVGVASAPVHHSGLSGLMHCADVAMYQAKRTGAGVVAYDAADDGAAARRNVTVLPELRRALQEGALELYYQPVLDAEGGLREVEALLRWRHPRRGLLPAAEFLPAVERTSLVRPLTEWVLDQAAAACATWRAAGYDVGVTVNVSARTLADPALPAAVLAAADRAGVPATRLCLEITEAAATGDPAAAAAALRQLADVGAGVVLDEVQAGFPVLTRLGAPPAAIKIDTGLVGAARHGGAARHAVAGLVAFAGHLGLGVVAEGVEDEETRRVVTALGCDAVQGYGVCPPLPAGEVTGWLATHGAPAVGPRRRPAPPGSARRRKPALPVTLRRAGALKDDWLPWTWQPVGQPGRLVPDRPGYGRRRAGDVGAARRVYDTVDRGAADRAGSGRCRRRLRRRADGPAVHRGGGPRCSGPTQWPRASLAGGRAGRRDFGGFPVRVAVRA